MGAGRERNPCPHGAEFDTEGLLFVEAKDHPGEEGTWAKYGGFLALHQVGIFAFCATFPHRSFQEAGLFNTEKQRQWCIKVLQKMTTTINLHPWNFMPMENLEHVFSFLPLTDRHNVSRMCKLWATAVSSASVWRFTEVYCDLDENERKDGGTLTTLLQKIQPYVGHIRYLKMVLDTFLELNWRLACIILDGMAQKTCRLQGLELCYSKMPFFSFGEELRNSLSRLFQVMDEATMQHVNFRHMPFALDNGLISLVGKRSPNLRTLLINNHLPWLPMLTTDTIVELLRSCPKLSTLGICYFALSRMMFQELLRPNREPFKYLELFYNGLDNDIPADCWTSMRERHPGFRVGLEFTGSIPRQKITEVLKPYLPISQLHFNAFIHMAKHVKIVANLYAGTLERLVLNSRSSSKLNMALIRLAIACVHLKEIHCFCEVSQEVVEAFRRHCPHLKQYTLSLTFFFPDSPPTVFL